MDNLEELKKKYKELEKEIERLEKEEKNKLWKPEKDEGYYTIDLYNEVDQRYWDNDKYDNIKYNRKLVFKTGEEAEQYAKYLKAKEEAIRNAEKLFKNTDTDKYRIRYDHWAHRFCTDSNKFFQCFNTPYFATKQKAQDFINKYEKQIKRDMGVE